MSITSLVSMSSKLTVPLSLRSCALASAASLNADAAVALTVGASFVPVMVKLTVSVAEAPWSSVAVTVNEKVMVSPSARKSRSTSLAL